MRATAMMLALLSGLACAGVARADDECAVPMSDWQPREAVEGMAAGQGWTVRRIRIDDGCYEVEVQDAKGHTVEVTVDPGTLVVLGVEVEDEDHDHDRSGEAPPPPDAGRHED